MKPAIENYNETTPSNGIQKLKVLFVDNNPSNELYDLLNEIEYSGTTSAEAIHKISERQIPYDAVVVNATISSDDIDTLRRLTNERNLPLILYTSFFDEKVKARALKLKADDYVSGSVRYSIGSQIMLAKRLREFSVQWLKQESKFKGQTAVKALQFFQKRIFDILVSLLALIMFSPLLLVLSIVQEIELMEKTILSDTKDKKLAGKIFDWYQFLVLILFSPIFAVIKLPLKIVKGKFQSNAVESASTRLDKILIRTTSATLAHLRHVLKGDISLFGAKSVPTLPWETKR